MLTDGEASGYDLKKTFESSFAHCFAAGFGSIYPALASLAEQGYVSCREIPQQGKPDRKVYRITAAGRQQLLTELDDPAPSHKVRSEFLATMAFAHLMTPQQINTVLDNRLEDVERNLAAIREFENSSDKEWPQGVQFTLGLGRTMMNAMKTYIEENRHVFSDDSARPNTSATG